MAAYKAFESSDALVALRAVYFAKFPPPQTYTQRPRPGVRGRGEEHTRVVDREVIGREALLLDEPLRQASDGRIVRMPVVQGRPKAKEERKDRREEEPIGWRVDEEDKKRLKMAINPQNIPTRLAMTANGQIMRVEYYDSLGCGMVEAVGKEGGEGGPAEELYHELIAEEECCELGGWLGTI